MEESGFCAAYERLPAKPATCIRFFDRGDYYTLHGDDALYAAKNIFKSQGVLKYYGAKKLPSCSMNQMLFETTIRDLLLQRRYRVEVFSSSGKSHQWAVTKKASPGNTQAFQDILYNSDLVQSSIVLAVTLQGSGNDQLVGVAFCDTAQASFGVCQFPDTAQFNNFEALLVQVGPKEVLLPSEQNNPLITKLSQISERYGAMVTPRRKADYQAKDVVQDLERLLKLAQDQKAAALPQVDEKAAMAALCCVIHYLDLLADDANTNKFRLSTFNFTQYMRLDSAAMRALNVFPAGPHSTKSHSLFGLLNHCKTLQGQRLLYQWLKQPLLDVNRIRERHDLETALKKMPDLSRLSKKFARQRARLQDVVSVYMAVKRLPDLIEHLQDFEGTHATLLHKQFLEDFTTLFEDFEKYLELVERTIDLEQADHQNYFIKPTFNEDMQKTREAIDTIEEEITSACEEAAEDLNLEYGKSLKCEQDAKSKQYLFRVTRAYDKLLRNNKAYTTIETQKNGIKFTNKRLSRLNEARQAQHDRYAEIQAEVAAKVIGIASGYEEPMEELNAVIAVLDVFLSLATASLRAPVPYVRPVMHAMGEGNITLKACRHPCLEVQDELAFIPNDVDLRREDGEFQIITGPNMGGKSTYIRQIGMAVLMAQIGCFVPANTAEIAVVDAVLARGISTFMAEMLETASILSAASRNSLIIVDELGRGTSTYDGFGLAWAISEHIAKTIGAFCLFATHFHELTALADELPSVVNLHVDALTSNNELTLLYKVKPGVCDQSFGIHVAEMVHFPAAVIEDAKRKAAELEDFENTGELGSTPDKKAKLEQREGEQLLSTFVDQVRSIQAEGLTPEQAFEKVAALRDKLAAHNNAYVRQRLGVRD
ncbi:uncharacterized protein MONBRDRAFT_34327 [Monosiga brevicollis MX1]|uniref:DNA mismatch repair protein MSH2 n=1 Tax=Monosiga brevicollis TaxID=81824 RepID=A9VAZ2_MONBE|nr:uncharacterized protein MONBRDRAFT_34327 [Monosiga brevicollis MX1]EDQ85301.1 predicted protein [Monosiga brevicollis MX1]|eukprot:XP_001749922.1 hypothetical protein [Monosiga brevicollis MX1]